MGEQNSSIRLKALNVPGWGKPIEIPAEGLTIGRDTSNGFVVASIDFPHVSARHAEIVRRDGQLVVRDLGSKNGTQIDGQGVEDDHPLATGEVLQLGYRGPKFLVTDDDFTGEDLDPTFLETVDVQASRDGLEREAETIVRVKRALGLSDGATVEDLIRARSRRNLLIGAGLGAIVVALVAGIAFMWKDDQRQDFTELMAQLKEWQQRQETQESDRLRTLQNEYRQLAEELARLQSKGTASDADIARLREQMDRTQQNIVKARGASVPVTSLGDAIARVRPAVVEVRVQTRYRQVETGAYLHVDGEQPNFDGRGVLWSIDNLGSGVCVSDRGDVLTNAHVVEYPRLDFSTYGWTVKAEQELFITFVDDPRPYPGRLIRKGVGDSNSVDDVALLRLAPFEGMPFVADFSTDLPPPADGDTAWLLGFPHGDFDVRRGVITHWNGFFKFDSAVNHGASGGPLVDEQGRVIGLAKGRRLDLQGKPIPGTGVAIPIAKAAQVWPTP